MYLVGGGPGDPGLLTLRGAELVASADAVLHDELVHPSLLELARADADVRPVGKRGGDPTAKQAKQAAIEEALIALAQAGRSVVRLKGGDPYIFGRGGEEVEALAAAGLEFEVVPGVTAALGLAAYTGVPLTHRDHTSSVTFVTGHDPDKIDWTRIGHAETLVVYMGLTTIGTIAERLIAAGRSADTPAVVVQRATTARQHTAFATLGTLAAVVREAHLKPPATIVIGEVAALRGRLASAGGRPGLTGRMFVMRIARFGSARSLSWASGIGVLVAVWVLGPAAEAQTLDRIRDAGKIRLGYEKDARPFSFENDTGKPGGYAVSL